MVILEGGTHLARVGSLCWGITSIKMRWLGWGKTVESQEYQLQEYGYQPSVIRNNEFLNLEMTQSKQCNLLKV